MESRDSVESFLHKKTNEEHTQGTETSYFFPFLPLTLLWYFGSDSEGLGTRPGSLAQPVATGIHCFVTHTAQTECAWHPPLK